MNPSTTHASAPAAPLPWACVALFAARVVAQVEALLLAPDWLPPMEAWHSGLVPYYLLLPAQIVLLVIMAAMAANPHLRDGSFAARRPRTATFMRVVAVMYFAFMAGRLTLLVIDHGEDFWLQGGIPVTFHWVLALFLLASFREAPPALESFWLETEDDEYGDAGTATYGDMPVISEPMLHGGRFPGDLRFSHAR